jgi:hypothetical protein
VTSLIIHNSEYVVDAISLKLRLAMSYYNNNNDNNNNNNSNNNNNNNLISPTNQAQSPGMSSTSSTANQPTTATSLTRTTTTRTTTNQPTATTTNQFNPSQIDSTIPRILRGLLDRSGAGPHTIPLLDDTLQYIIQCLAILNDYSS